MCVSTVNLTHPVRICIQVPWSQRLQGPSVMVKTHPGGLPSGQLGAILPKRLSASWAICLFPTLPIGLDVIAEKQLIFRVLAGGHNAGCRGLLLWKTIRLLVQIHFRFLEESREGNRLMLNIIHEILKLLWYFVKKTMHQSLYQT